MPRDPERTELLRRLHDDEELLVMVNVWDVASARTVAAQPGCRAVATASWSVAATLGLPDGEALTRDAMLEVVARIAAGVDVPVSADLEAGYGDVATTTTLAAEAGVAGCNLEDGTADGSLRTLDDAVARVGEAVGSGLVVNARTDAFLRGVEGAFDVAVERGRAFLAAGADCVFVPGVADEDTIRRLAAAIGPLSVLAVPSSPPLAGLRALGVRRVSFGPGTLGVATAALATAARVLLDRGAYPDDLRHRPPHP